MKYNAGECKRDNCHYFHACSIRLPSGRPCMQNHAAKDHRGSTWLGDIDPDLQSSEPHLQNSYSTIHHPEAPNLYLTDSDQSTSSLPTPVLPTSNNTSTTITEASFDSPSLFTTSVSTPSTLPNTSDSNRQSNINTPSATTQASQPIRLFLDFFAGHGAPLLRSHRSQHWSFYPFDIEFDHTCDILNNDHIENPLKLAHSGLIGAIRSAPPCRLYSSLRKNDGGPPPLRSNRVQRDTFSSQFSNKEVLQDKNNLSILWPGRNNLTNSSYPNVPVTW